MVHKIADWIKNCPFIEDVTACSVSPGTGTGIFPKGISRVSRDILGNCSVTISLLLRHRGRPEENWPALVSSWVLTTEPPLGCRSVTPKGGKLCSPTKDGWGTWEMELVIETV